jgi:DNA-binding NarL/FixJ family response regulator
MVSQERIRILSVDDHRLFRQGMAAVIRSQPDMVLVAEAASGIEAVEKFCAQRPDITLLDARLPGMSGVEVMVAIRVQFPNARILLVSTFEGDLDPQSALQAGAWGHILKTMHPREIVNAIRQVHAGRKCTPLLPGSPLAVQVTEGLTAREVEVLAHAAGGKPNRDIGRRLLISEEMVKGHLKKILNKLGARNYANALTIAARRGFIRL